MDGIFLWPQQYFIKHLAIGKIGDTGPNGDDGGTEPTGGSNYYLASLRDLPAGQTHTVGVSTLFNGKEIVEARFEVMPRPRHPKSVTKAKWGFALSGTR